MSFQAVCWSVNQKLPPREKLVLLMVANFYNEQEKCAWMSQQTLADMTGYTRATINTALQSLEDEYRLIQSRGRIDENGRTTTKVYRLAIGLGTFPAVNETNTQMSTKLTGYVNEIDTGYVNGVDTNQLDMNQLKEQIHSSAKPTSIQFDDYLEAWNNNRGPLRKATKLNQWRKQKIKAHQRENKNEALHMFTIATQQVANNDYWIEQGFGLDNLLRNKILHYYEQAQAQETQRPRILDHDILDPNWNFD